MKRLVIACVVLLVLVPAARGGVVVEMGVTTPESPEDAGTETFYAQGEMARMDMPGEGELGSVIFHDQTMYFVDHKKKTCQEITKQDVDQLAEQLGEMTKELDKLPPEQRAMMEQMMKGKMPGTKEPPTQNVEKGGTDQVGEYTCTMYTLYSNDEKVEDVCMADASVGADIAEAMGAFHALARFSEGLMDVAESLPFGKSLEIPFQKVYEMDGFPVRTRRYDSDGYLVEERVLQSVTRRDIEPEVFEPPKGYKIKSLGAELKKGKH